MRPFAVEVDTAQIVWPARPGMAPVATETSGLFPGRNHVLVTRPGSDETASVTIDTLAAPPGRELFRFATLNDLHFGERAFGFFRTMRESGADVPYPVRCARAALAEALDWGAELIVLKGDLTDLGRPSHWRQIVDVFGGCAVPVLAIPGNHDVSRRAVDERGLLADAGIRLAYEPTAHDVPGLRIVLGQSAVTGRSGGRVGRVQRERLAELAGEADGACFVALHHQPQPLPFKLYHPPGIPGPQARALIDALAEANPATILASGHTHRHRHRRRGPVVITEVGSPKDYPGTWAGYVVHEGGIRQVVRRVAAADCIAWTEHTRRAVLGVWGLWSPGRLADRCWSHTWPAR